MVDTRDVAAVAAVVLSEPGHAGADYDVTGPEALSYADVAAKLSGALGRQVSYADVPDDAARRRCRRRPQPRGSRARWSACTRTTAGRGWTVTPPKSPTP